MDGNTAFPIFVPQAAVADNLATSGASINSSRLPSKEIYVHELCTGTGRWDFAASEASSSPFVGVDNIDFKQGNTYRFCNVNGTNFTTYRLAKELKIFRQGIGLQFDEGVYLRASDTPAGGMTQVVSFNPNQNTNAADAPTGFILTPELWRGQLRIDGNNRINTALNLQSVANCRTGSLRVGRATNGVTAWNCDYIYAEDWSAHPNDFHRDVAFGQSTLVNPLVLQSRTQATPLNLTFSDGSTLGNYSLTFANCRFMLGTGVGVTGSQIALCQWVGGSIQNNLGGNVVLNGVDPGGAIGTTYPSFDNLFACDIEVTGGTNSTSIATLNNSIRNEFTGVYAPNGVWNINAGSTSNRFYGGSASKFIDNGGHNFYHTTYSAQGYTGSGMGTATCIQAYTTNTSRYYTSSETMQGIAFANNPEVLFPMSENSGTAITSIGSITGTNAIGTCSSTNMTGGVPICLGSPGHSLVFDGTQTATIPSSAFEGMSGDWTIAMTLQAPTAAPGADQYILSRDDVGAKRQIDFSETTAGRVYVDLFTGNSTYLNTIHSPVTPNLLDGLTHALVLRYTKSTGIFRLYFDEPGDGTGVTQLIGTAGQAYSAPVGLVATLGNRPAAPSKWTGKMQHLVINATQACSDDWAAKYCKAARQGIFT